MDCTFGPWPCQRAVNLWAGHLRARDLGVAQKQAQEGEGGPPWQRGDGRERVAPMLGTVWPAPGGIITGRLSVIGSHPKVLRPPPARGERWPSGDRSVGAMRGSPYGGGLGGGCSAGDLITRSRRLTEPTNRACCKGFSRSTHPSYPQILLRRPLCRDLPRPAGGQYLAPARAPRWPGRSGSVAAHRRVHGLFLHQHLDG